MRRTVGVEEELLLVASDRTAPAADAVVDDRFVEPEFKQEQVEIASQPQRDSAALQAELIDQRGRAAHSAAEHGVRIAALGTSPVKTRPHGTPNDRYRRMVQEFGLLGASQLTCGQHIHVSIGSRAEGVHVLDRIRGWLPVLLALSANSPFWEHEDTGYASFRAVLWGRWPSAGPTELFCDERGYDAAVQAQLDAGSALDDGMIYFDARLSARYPTVEIRVADVCSDVRDAVLLAALARALVDDAAATDAEPLAIGLPMLRAATWRAARFGLTGALLDPVTGTQLEAWTLVDRLVERLSAALRVNDDLDLVRAGLARIRAHGTGSDRQREVFARTGGDLAAVLADSADRTVAAYPGS